MTKAEKEKMAKLEAKVALLEKQRNIKPLEGVIFAKREGAHPQAPDFSGHFYDHEGKRWNIAYWWNRNKTALNARISEPLAKEVEREENRDPSFIPSIDAK